MSNKTRLQDNNIALQSLIDKANSLPDAGSGGGSGSTETCTVNVSYISEMMIIGKIYYTKLGDNGYENITLTIDDFNYTGVLENVVCYSAIVITYEETANPIIEFSSNIVQIAEWYLYGGNVFLSTSSSNGTITITNNY